MALRAAASGALDGLNRASAAASHLWLNVRLTEPHRGGASAYGLYPPAEIKSVIMAANLNCHSDHQAWAAARGGNSVPAGASRSRATPIHGALAHAHYCNHVNV